MPSGQEYGNRLRDDVRRSLSQHLLRLEEEFQDIQKNLTSSLTKVRQTLVPVLNLEVPTAGPLIQQVINEGAQRRRQETVFLADFAHSLSQRETQEDILNSLLDGAHHYSPKVALFVARSEQFVGWWSRGYSPALAQQLSQSSLSQSETPLLRQAMAGEGAVSAEDLSHEEKLSRILRGEATAPLHAFSLKVLRRPLAVLLLASDAEHPCDLDSLSIVMTLTGLCIENLSLKILQEISTAPGDKAKKPSARPAPQPAPVGLAPPHERPPATVAAGDHEPEKIEPLTPGVGVGVEAAHAPGLSGAMSMAASAGAAAEAADASAHAAKETSKAESAPDRASATMEIVRELSEEERLHSEAKRFARLLVSEIKLYNEQKVVEGRANKDLYVRLKRDIDRSRDMYEKRVSPVVAHKIDYFHSELIRILGENDHSLLGSDYPGPRVEG